MNDKWAYALIDSLVQAGVQTFCIAPGSRSTPLALAVAEHPKAKHIVHFDERGVAFYALGLSFGSKTPVAIITTSGSATAYLLAVAMEAHYSRIPLLLITADRPPELRDCGANQTVDQVRLFGKYVRWEADLGVEIPIDTLAANAAYAVFKAKSQPAGPVHLNCMFREPLSTLVRERTPAPLFTFEIGQIEPTATQIDNALHLLANKKGLVIAASGLDQESLSALQLLRWPLYRSQIRFLDWMVELKECPIPEVILYVGDRIVSKPIELWLKDKPILHLADHPLRHGIGIRHHTIAHIPSFCRALANRLPPADDSWMRSWLELDDHVEEVLTEGLAQESSLVEPHLFAELSKTLPSSWGVFFGNSMPIRHASRFFHPRKIAGWMVNRGHSGIDGNVATAFGFAEGLRAPVLCVIGDLTALHDLNSLALARSTQAPVVFCILNNGGGGIFSHLSVAHQTDAFETLLAAAHPFSFEAAAAMFHLPYKLVETKEAFSFTEETQIIELRTNRTQEVRCLEQLRSHLSASFSTVS